MITTAHQTAAPPDTPVQAPLDALPDPILRELRSDHAGELGAVWVYRGVLAVSRDPEVRAFAGEHMATEQQHLAFFLEELPARWHSRLAPLWRLAGFLLGALPALLGRRAVYRTVAAIESFVDGHYAEQIDMLAAHPTHAWLRDRLARFRADELHHRDEAAARSGGTPVRGAWAAVVLRGSALGAEIARRV